MSVSLVQLFTKKPRIFTIANKNKERKEKTLKDKKSFNLIIILDKYINYLKTI